MHTGSHIPHVLVPEVGLSNHTKVGNLPLNLLKIHGAPEILMPEVLCGYTGPPSQGLGPLSSRSWIARFSTGIPKTCRLPGPEPRS